MVSHAAVLDPPTKRQIANSIAGVLPSELSQSPLMGILGVVLGAGIVTLTGRMLTLGTADLKGSLGIGYDDGAWIGSAFNIALMFIGPFTVYLGGLLGARRVLLIAAGSFTVICLLLPLAHSYGLLLTGLVLAGLTSGTFYPLTLTFALRLCSFPFTTASLLLRRGRGLGPFRALRGSFMQARDLRCCLPRSTRARDWTGGAPGSSTPCFLGQWFSCQGHSFAVCAARTRWSIFPTCGNGTQWF